MMKRATVFAVMLLLAIVGQGASAQLLNQDFNFSGNLTANGWTAHSGTGTNALATTTGLTYAGYIGSGIGNAAFVSNLGGEDANVPLVDSVYTNGKTVYTSFMVDVTDTSSNKTGDYFLHLGNRSTASVFTSFAARLFAKIVNGNVNFGISNLSTAGTMKYSATDYAKNTSYLVVLKYTINTGGVDTLKMWVKSSGVPTSETAAGAPDAVADSSIQLGQDIIDALALRQGSSSTSVGVVVDGIRVDTTWDGALGIVPAGPNVYSIGTGNVPGEVEHYASLKAACDSINAHTTEITEDRIYYITSDLTEATNVNIAGNNGGHTITFKPYTGVSATITFSQVADNTGLSGGFVIGVKDLVTTSATNYGVTMNDSTQNIVIDGSNTDGGKTRDLTIKTAAGISGNTNPIRIFGNTNNITIKNVIVSTGQSVSYAILTTVRQTATVGYAGTYVPDFITVDNCDVTNNFGNAGQGIAVSNSGTPTSFPIGVVFSNNKITARTRGILLNNSGNTDITGNEISVTQIAAGSLSEGIFALTIGTATSVTNIINNKITVLSTANTTAGSYGIEGIQISSQGVYNVFNNVVTGFIFPNLAQGLFFGIDVTTATTNPFTANIYYNSVYMANGSNTVGATPPTQAAFNLNLSGASGTRAANVMNNIFANLEGDYATQAIRVAATNTGTLVSDYNDLFSAGGSGMVGQFGATNCATLADWKTASSQDANSVSGNPGFISESDLHINPTMYPVSVVSNAGTPIGAVTTDIDGDLRDATHPDIGADEYVATPIIPISGFSVSPSSYDFGKVWKDSTKTDSVTVTNNGNSAHLLIDSVKSTNPLFTIAPTTADIDTSASKKFAITFSPIAKGAQTGYIIFYHNAPSAVDTLTVSGMGIIKEPLFTATPSSVKFSGVLVGKSKMDSIVVKNTGTDSLHISTVASSDAMFTVTPTAANLDTMASQKFYITFSPTSAGAKSASIVFTSNVEELKDTVKAYGNGSTIVTIAEARKDDDHNFIADHTVTGDTLVSVGIITTPNMGASASQTSYFIQDATGGIDVFAFGLPITTYAIGDSVMVTGTVKQYKGLVEFSLLALDDAHFTILKHNAAVPAPKKLTVHELLTNAENYEGQLVELDTLVKATGTWPATPANVSVYMMNYSHTDTIQMFLDLDANIGGTEPAYPVKVIGFISQYSSSVVPSDGYEICPRSADDITEMTVLGVNDRFSGIPKTYELQNNYPNPFNPSTTILYGLPEESRVEVTIYSILGQVVKTLVNDVQKPSYYHVVWNGTTDAGSQVSSGVYFVRITAKSSDNTKSFVQVKKMLMMK